MAKRLETAVAAIDGVTVVRPVQANVVFAARPREVSKLQQKRFRFYFWDEHTCEVRCRCWFDTTEADIDASASAIAEEVGAALYATSLDEQWVRRVGAGGCQGDTVRGRSILGPAGRQGSATSERDSLIRCASCCRLGANADSGVLP
jgi:hypothetical protein